MNKTRLWKTVFVLLFCFLFVSLWFNYQSYRKHVFTHSWKHYAYYDFASGIILAADHLGWHNLEKSPERAALGIGEAAMSLEQMAAYEDITTTQTTPELRDQYSVQSPPHVEDVAHYLSYVASIIANPNSADYQGEVSSAERYVINVAQLLAREAGKNGVLSDIPDSVANRIFTQMYNQIPSSDRNDDPHLRMSVFDLS